MGLFVPLQAFAEPLLLITQQVVTIGQSTDHLVRKLQVLLGADKIRAGLLLVLHRFNTEHVNAQRRNG